MSSAWTSRNRSPTLTAICSRWSWRSPTSLTIFSSCSFNGAVGSNPPARALDRLLQALRLDRLQQVVDRVHLERLDRVLVERGHEDDVACQLPLDQPARHLEARQPGHLHVQEHHVGLQALDGSQRLEAVGRLPHHLDVAELAEQEAQLVARQLFVVDDDRSQRLMLAARLRAGHTGRHAGRVPPVSAVCIVQCILHIQAVRAAASPESRCGRRCLRPGRSSASAGSRRRR